MIPKSVQKMIDEAGNEFQEKVHYGSSQKHNFEAGASFSYELGFSQGIEAVVGFMKQKAHDFLAYPDDRYKVGLYWEQHAMLIESHFKDHLRKTE